MKSIRKFWNNYQAKRIDQILNWPTSRVLSNRWVKRFLASTAVISSWCYLLLLIPGMFPEIYPTLPYQLLAGLVMLSSFMLLRQSVKRITSLPDEYLDEREVANRDWAYRLGYLVVRRIGLFATLALIGFSIYVKLGGVLITVENVTEVPGSPSSHLYQDASDFVRSYFALSPLENILLIMVLLTFVAYSFPVILLAWRESNSVQLVPPFSEWKDSLHRYSKGYFARLLRIFWIVLLSFVVAIGHLQDFWINLVVLSEFYSIYVYFWALFIQFEILGKLKSFAVSEASVAKNLRVLKVIAIASVAIGITVPISSMYTGLYKSNQYLFVAILCLLVLQVVSFSITRKMSKGSN